MNKPKPVSTVRQPSGLFVRQKTALPLFLLGAALWQPTMAIASPHESLQPAAGSWTLTASLRRAHQSHSATLLSDGKVLVAGGIGRNQRILPTTELYDPATGTWTPSVNLIVGIHSHTATLLPDGKVLVAGGTDSNNLPVADAQLYDPATEMWS